MGTRVTIPSAELSGLDRSVMLATSARYLLPQDLILRTKGGGNFQLYLDQLTDDKVKSTLEQRRRAVIAKPWEVEPGGPSQLDKDAATWVEDTLNALDFDAICERMHYGIFFGWSLGECIYREGPGGRVELADVRVRPITRFRWGKPRKETDGLAHTPLLLITPQQMLGEEMPPNKFWTMTCGGVHDDDPYGLGLAHYTYWPVFFKHADVPLWLRALERWGMPVPKAAMEDADFQDEEKRGQVMDALDGFMATGKVIVPKSTDLELIQAAKSGAGDFKDLKEAMDDAITHLILTQTMTSNDGASRSQAEVHKDMLDLVVASDADLMMGSLTRPSTALTGPGPLTWMVEWNFPGAKVPKVWRNVERQGDTKAMAERDEKVFGMGFKPSLDYIKETYGEGWEIDTTPRQAAPTAGPPANGAGLPTFAERSLNPAILGRKMDHAALDQGADQLATRWREHITPRVQPLLDKLALDGDVAAFTEGLQGLMDDPPAPSLVQALTQGNVVARLLARLRHQ